MESYLIDWLNLIARWTHLVTGIAWIGASFYFVWLDNHLLPAADPNATKRGVGGELWSVHGGGFYHAQKYRLAPPAMPQHLHWFYWEAYSTFLSGFFLLAVLYYSAPRLYLIDPAVLELTPPAAVLLGLCWLAGGWVVYDLLCRSPLGRNDRALGAVLLLVLTGAAWGLCQVFSGRGAFLHFGAMLGTVMVANVFFVIIPGQRRTVAALAAGRDPDPADGARGKQRSVHNTYFTLPVLFTMISNHYAMSSGARHNWAVLVGLCLAGAAVRAWFVARHKAHERHGKTSPLPLIVGALSMLAVIWALRPVPAVQDEVPAFSEAYAIVQARCNACHAARPSFAGYVEAPKGAMFDTPDRFVNQLTPIRQQVASRAMPLGNITGMSDGERRTLLAWIDAGAPR